MNRGMPNLTVGLSSKVSDPKLAAWIAKDGPETYDILVEAVLPARRVLLESRPGGLARAIDVQSAGTQLERVEALRRLAALLQGLLDAPPVVLEAAGALAVRASSRQVRKFIEHP